MAQFQKVSTEVYGNTPNNVYQRPYNPVAHESSVRVSPTNIWDAPSTSPIYNSTLLLFSPEDFKPLRSFFLSLLFFPFLRGCAHPVVCHKPPRTSVELSLQRRHKCRIRHTHTQSGWTKDSNISGGIQRERLSLNKAFKEDLSPRCRSGAWLPQGYKLTNWA